MAEHHPLPSGSYDYGLEIVRAVGPLTKGARIILSALPSLRVKRPNELLIFQYHIRIDDNDAPGTATRLDLNTTQNPRELEVLCTRGGIIEITVDHMYEDGIVHGVVKILGAAGEDGRIMPTPEVDRSRVSGAIITPVFDAAGKEVWFHALVLDKNNAKVSAEGKRRFLIANGMADHLPDHRPIRAVTPTFAPLAGRLLRAIARGGFEFSLTLRDAYLRWQLPDTGMIDFKPGFTQLQRRLREAHKIVFDPDFSQLVVEVAQQDPKLLLRMLRTARPPFGECWIEWQRGTHRRDLDDDDGTVLHWGMLIWPDESADFYTATLTWARTDDGVPMVVPGALLFNFRDPFDFDDPRVSVSLSPQLRAQILVGNDYYKRWADTCQLELEELGGHAEHTMGGPPYGVRFGRFVSAMLRERPPGFEQARQELMILLASGSQIWRELITGCALVATHIGGEPLIKETRILSKSAFYKGKFHPPIEYKVLQLRRPVEAPKVTRMLRRVKSDQPVRWHQVIGSWHHRRTPNAQCRHHPRACPVALWQVEATEEPTDTQICALCKRSRWWVRDHARGDAGVGMLEKSYEITAR